MTAAVPGVDVPEFIELDPEVAPTTGDSFYTGDKVFTFQQFAGSEAGDYVITDNRTLDFRTVEERLRVIEAALGITSPEETTTPTESTDLSSEDSGSSSY